MKSTSLSITLICVSLSFAGCSSSPIAPKSTSLSGTQMAGIGLGAVLGGASGAALDKIHPERGAAIGAAAGTAITAIAETAYNSSAAQHDAEVAEQAKREERLKMMKADWYDKTQSYQEEPSQTGVTPKEIVTDDSGTYQGVPFFNRTRKVGSREPINSRPRS